jgi:phage-related protein
MRDDIPGAQKSDAHALESKGLRALFRIELRDEGFTTLYLTPHNTFNFMGRQWQSLPVQLSDVAHNSSGEMSRPKLTVANPAGMFSLWVGAGYLQNAVVTYYEVLASDIDIGAWNYSRNVWIASKVLSLSRDVVVLELRTMLDGFNYTLPARNFYPPDFDHVSLQ